MLRSILVSLKIPNPENCTFTAYIPNPYTGKKGYLTRLDAENYSGSHKQFYEELIRQLAITL